MNPDIPSGAEEEWINLAVPNPPETYKYPEIEDWRQAKLLEINGVVLSQDALGRILAQSDQGLQAAAAHSCGSLGFGAVIPQLERLAATADDLVQVEAAYALVRLGKGEQSQVLSHCLTLPVNAYLCPPVAAGYLARLQDPQGFAVIVECLAQDLTAVRMMGCKQLYFFVPFHGTRDHTGQVRDVFAQFARALQDVEPDVQWQALVQLRDLASPPAHALLQTYLSTTKDPTLRQAAEAALANPPA